MQIRITAAYVHRTDALEIIQHNFKMRNTLSTVEGSAPLWIRASTPLPWIQMEISLSLFVVITGVTSANVFPVVPQPLQISSSAICDRSPRRSLFLCTTSLRLNRYSGALRADLHTQLLYFAHFATVILYSKKHPRIADSIRYFRDGAQTIMFQPYQSTKSWFVVVRILRLRSISSIIWNSTKCNVLQQYQNIALSQQDLPFSQQSIPCLYCQCLMCMFQRLKWQ